MPDHAVFPPDVPATEPAHPKPAATARTVAAGVFFAALASLTAAAAVLTIAATAFVVIAFVALVGAVNVQLETNSASTVLLVLGFAAATAATLLVLTRRWALLRPATVVLTVVAAGAWPVSRIAAPAALLAVVAIGLAASRDRRTDGGRRLRGARPPAWLAVGAVVLAGAAAAAAASRPEDPRLETQAAHEPSSAVEPSATPESKRKKAGKAQPAKAPATPRATPEPTPRATPEPTPSATPEPTPSATPEPTPSAAPEPTPSATPEPTPSAAPEPTPSATPAPSRVASAPTDGAADFVRAYYGALDEQRFEDAWRALTPAVRTRFGAFERWKGGYTRTISSRPRDVVASATGSDVTVKHVLVARDKGCAGTREFAVTWRLRRVAEQWRVVGLTAQPRGPQRKCR